MEWAIYGSRFLRAVEPARRVCCLFLEPWTEDFFCERLVGAPRFGTLRARQPVFERLVYTENVRGVFGRKVDARVPLHSMRIKCYV